MKRHTSEALRDAVALIRVELARIRRQSRSTLRRIMRPNTVVVRGIRLELENWWASDVIRTSIYEGNYESDEHTILGATLRMDDRYLEIGAGIGFICSYACSIVGARDVFAFEANPELASLCLATAERNGYSPTVVNAILADRDGELDFFVQPDFWISSLSPSPTARRITVPAQSFSDALSRIQPTYLMIDIEGGEHDLLGSVMLPPFVRALCIELHADVIGADAVRELMVCLMRQRFSVDLMRSRASVVFFYRSTG